MGHPQSNLRFVITGGSKKTIITFTNSPEVIANLKDLIDSFCSIHNTKNNIYKAKAAEHEDMLLLSVNDKVELGLSGTKIMTCNKIN